VEVLGSDPGGRDILPISTHAPIVLSISDLFYGVKPPGQGVHHTYPSSDEVKERVELDSVSYLPLCLRGMFQGELHLAFTRTPSAVVF
jgi:hypothetical protein